MLNVTTFTGATSFYSPPFLQGLSLGNQMPTINTGGVSYDNIVAVEPNTGLTINYAIAAQYNYMFDSVV